MLERKTYLSKGLFWISRMMCVICIISISGCNYREIDDMPMITALAIDKRENEFVLTAKVILPEGSEQGSINEQIFIQTKGKTVFDAIRDIIMKEGERSFWGELEFIIINEKISEDNIGEVLDFFIRGDEVRQDIWLLISDKEQEAGDIMIDTLSDKRLQFYISDALINGDYVSKYFPVILNDFVNTLSSNEKEEVLPFLRMEKSLGVNRVLINGGVVFKDEKSIGRLSGLEMMNYRLIINEENGGIRVIVYNESMQESNISFEVSNSTSKMKVVKKDGTYSLHVEATVIGSVGEISNTQINLLDRKNREKFIEQAEVQIKSELELLIIKVQKEYGSDIFGFGEHFKDQFPSEFKKIEEDWNAVFSSLPVEVSVKVVKKGSALVRQPLKKGE